MGITYATREQLSTSLEIMDAAHVGHTIDAKLQAGSRSAEGFLHRRFYPERRTILLDWPARGNYGPSWEIDLGSNEMISLETVVAGGVTITDDCILRRRDDLAEPPYNILQVDLSTNSVFASGNTWQQSISVLGLFGDKDTATVTPGGSLGANINSSVTSINVEPASGLLTVGTGSLLLCGTERMITVARTMVSTGFTTTSALLESQAATTFTTASASSLAEGETILLDGERMLINTIAGSTVLVTRAFDGTPLQAHSSGTTIYALRQYVVQRGALGSTAASHNDGDSIYVHEFHPLVNELTIAEATVLLYQHSSAYARTIGSGTSTREAVGKGLDDVRQRAWMALGRKTRSGAV